MELRRILSKSALWMLTAGCLVLSLFLFHRGQEQRFEEYREWFGSEAGEVSAEWERQMAAMANLTPAEACEVNEAALQRDTETLTWTLERVVRERLTTPVVTYRKEYPAYLKQVQQNAALMKSVSIFTGKGFFSRRNIEKTASDFQRIGDVSPAVINPLGISALFHDHTADILILAVMIFICLVMLEEYRSGLVGVIRLSHRGRLELSLRRAGILTGAVAVLGALFYGSQVVATIRSYGTIAWNVPAQSVPELGQLTIPVTLGECLIRFFLIKAGGILLITLLFWWLAVYFREVSVSCAAAGCVLGAEYALFVWIPVQSSLNSLKYINLMAWIFPEEVFTHYLNMNLFGYPVNALEAAQVLLPGLLLTACVLCCLSSLLSPEKRSGPLFRLKTAVSLIGEAWAARLPGRLAELHRVFISHGGLVVTALMLAVVCRVFPDAVKGSPYTRTLEESYQEQWEGTAEEASGEILRKKSELAERIAYADSVAEAFRLGNATENQVVTAGIAASAAENALRAIGNVEGALTEMEEEGVTPWIVNDHWLRKLLASESDQRILAVLALLSFTLIVLPDASLQAAKARRDLLRIQPRGRGTLWFQREITVVISAAAVMTVVYGTHYYGVIRIYGAHGLDAPVQVMEPLRHAGSHLTVRQMLVLVYGLRFLVLLAVGQGCLMAAELIPEPRAAAAVGLLVFVIPGAVWAAGADALRPVNPAGLLSCFENLVLFYEKGAREIAGYFAVTVFGVSAGLLAGRHWIHTGSGERNAG